MSENCQEDELKTWPSPVQLTNIRDFPPEANVDTVTLKDLIGDPLIKSMWQFNFIFDVGFLMSGLDEDVRHLVQVNIVHGYWKKDDPGRQYLYETAAPYPNVKLITAYMPEAYGTHHSKMMILFRHDDTAQVIIHTANMVLKDWINMSQAVWRSPKLPLLHETSTPQKSDVDSLALGSGKRFKKDLEHYISFYGNQRTGMLAAELAKYDFFTVKAALVASVPSKLKVQSVGRDHSKPLWGWQGLKDVLRQIPSAASSARHATVVTQVSSVATLGSKDDWLKDLQKALGATSNLLGQPRFRIIFPTEVEVRNSIDGYAAGGSIRWRTESAAQKKQVEYMRSMMCYWTGEGHADTAESLASVASNSRTSAQLSTLAASLTPTPRSTTIREAGRRRAAPHIKTYIRFANNEMDQIDWAMVTSANLSKQAWGWLPNKNGEVRICSYEIGVILWPQLFEDSTLTPSPSKAVMVPTFKTDRPHHSVIGADVNTVVGFRMPYDLPLVRYAPDDEPWCVTSNHAIPDHKGRVFLHPGRRADQDKSRGND